MQLIKIINVPIEYKMQIEHARLEMQNNTAAPQSNPNTDIAKLNLQHTDIKMQQDSTAMWESIGLKSPGSFMRDVAQKTKADSIEAIGQIVQDGNMMAQPNVTVSDIVASKLYDTDYETVTTFLPTTGPAISWQPNQLSVDYQPGTVTFDWDVLKGTMKFVPGDFNIEILQYPKIEIEYIGGFNYCPPSSDPNYKEPV